MHPMYSQVYESQEHYLILLAKEGERSSETGTKVMEVQCVRESKTIC